MKAPSKVQVQMGLDVAVRAEKFSGVRIAVATTGAAVSRSLRWIVPALADSGARIQALFSPEHGLFGAEADAMAVDSSTCVLEDRRVPIHSLYGARERPTSEMLGGIDAVVFDMPDIGSRFYTYIWTLSYVLDACSETGIPLIVLDRPNPITGAIIEGPGVQPGFQAFEGRRSIPIRHGWTVGEFARWYNSTLARPAKLEIV